MYITRNPSSCPSPNNHSRLQIHKANKSQPPHAYTNSLTNRRTPILPGIITPHCFLPSNSAHAKNRGKSAISRTYSRTMKKSAAKKKERKKNIPALIKRPWHSWPRARRRTAAAAAAWKLDQGHAASARRGALETRRARRLSAQGESRKHIYTYNTGASQESSLV